MTAKLELVDVVAGYGATRVLHGVNLQVQAGGITALLGANGAGKTTTLRAISGLIGTTSGAVKVDGRDVNGLAPHRIAALGIGHVPDGRGTISELTVQENLEVGGHLVRGAAQVAQRVDEMYALFPILRERRAQQAGTLSGGEQQMLAISRALMARPQLLLLDEPSFGIAPLVVQKIFETLREINRRDGITILLIEQNANLAFDAASHAYVLEGGRVAVHGPTDELRHDEAVRRSYLGG